MVGHGVRHRRVRGVFVWGARPEEVAIAVRRYRCRACGAVVVVVPRGVLPGRRYLATAIALALVLYGVKGLSHPEVREAVSPAKRHGLDAHARWRTLARWVDDVGRRSLVGRLLGATAGTPRRAAAALYARALAALSRRSDSIIELSAMDGAMMATMP